MEEELERLRQQNEYLLKALLAAQQIVDQCDCVFDEAGRIKQRYYRLRDLALDGEN